jgi:glycerophosphoryl diester phosphodiesterase
MQFLAHRGQWSDLVPKNSLPALKLALSSGFGLETDLRDQSSEAVVSHDPPKTKSLLVAELLELYNCVGSQSPLALNIKSDGIGVWLKALLDRFQITNYYCFDMSVPEMLSYRRLGLRYFTRESEYEKSSPLYQDSDGVWMDQFNSEWIKPNDIRRHFDCGKSVALVSPELHGRNPIPFWTLLRGEGLHSSRNLMLCTDFPEKAQNFFEVF